MGTAGGWHLNMTGKIREVEEERIGGESESEEGRGEERRIGVENGEDEAKRDLDE